MAKDMKRRIADWHGEQAALAYCLWQRFGHDQDLSAFVRHTAVADKLWR